MGDAIKTVKQSKEQSIRQNKKQSQKPQYNMWQNTIFMLKNAWHVCKSVIFICVALAAVTAGKTIAEMLIAPAILEKVQTTAPLTELLAVIAEFGIILVILAGLKEYLERNTMFGVLLCAVFSSGKLAVKMQIHLIQIHWIQILLTLRIRHPMPAPVMPRQQK